MAEGGSPKLEINNAGCGHGNLFSQEDGKTEVGESAAVVRGCCIITG